MTDEFDPVPGWNHRKDLFERELERLATKHKVTVDEIRLAYRLFLDGVPSEIRSWSEADEFLGHSEPAHVRRARKS